MFEFLWSDESEAHIARHNVIPSEVEEAAGPPHHHYQGRNDTTILLGVTYAGRYLFVVIAEAPDGRWTPVTARDMEENERKAYERKAR